MKCCKVGTGKKSCFSEKEIKPAVNQIETHVFQQQNFDLFDFTLSAGDMAAIEALDGGESLFFSHYDPKTVEWFMSLL